MDYQAVGHAGPLLAEGVLIVDYFGSKAGMVFGRVEASQEADDALGIRVVNHGTVLRHLLLVEQIVGTETMDIAHKKVAGYRVVGALADALTHAAAGTVGKGKAYHVGIVDTVGMGMNDAFGQDECLATARWGQHQMAALMQVDDGLLVSIGATQLLRSWQGCAAGRHCGPW